MQNGIDVKTVSSMLGHSSAGFTLATYTHAIAGGVDAKTLSGILGHTNASFTLDTYTHVTPDMQKAASNIVGGFMENLFGKELKPWQRDGRTEPAR